MGWQSRRYLFHWSEGDPLWSFGVVVSCLRLVVVGHEKFSRGYGHTSVGQGLCPTYKGRIVSLHYPDLGTRYTVFLWLEFSCVGRFAKLPSNHKNIYQLQPLVLIMYVYVK